MKVRGIPSVVGKCLVLLKPKEITHCLFLSCLCHRFLQEEGFWRSSGSWTIDLRVTGPRASWNCLCNSLNLCGSIISFPGAFKILKWFVSLQRGKIASILIILSSFAYIIKSLQLTLMDHETVVQQLSHLVQGHRAGRWQNLDSDPAVRRQSPCFSRLCLFTKHVFCISLFYLV